MASTKSKSASHCIAVLLNCLWVAKWLPTPGERLQLRMKYILRASNDCAKNVCLPLSCFSCLCGSVCNSLRGELSCTFARHMWSNLQSYFIIGRANTPHSFEIKLLFISIESVQRACFTCHEINVRFEIVHWRYNSCSQFRNKTIMPYVARSGSALSFRKMFIKLKILYVVVRRQFHAQCVRICLVSSRDWYFYCEPFERAIHGMHHMFLLDMTNTKWCLT